MSIELTSNIINDLVNKGYNKGYFIGTNYLEKLYSNVFGVTFQHSVRKPDQIELYCVFNTTLLDNFNRDTFPELEIEKQLIEIFGSCNFVAYNLTFQIIFYIHEEENLIKWIDTLEKDTNEFISLVVDLINDMLL